MQLQKRHHKYKTNAQAWAIREFKTQFMFQSFTVKANRRKAACGAATAITEGLSPVH